MHLLQYVYDLMTFSLMQRCVCVMRLFVIYMQVYQSYATLLNYIQHAGVMAHCHIRFGANMLEISLNAK